MVKDREECTFNELPDEALFIEAAEGDQPLDLNGYHDLYEKCGDHEMALVGSIIDGTARLNPQRGSPTPDHINGRTRVVFVARNQIMSQAA